MTPLFALTITNKPVFVSVSVFTDVTRVPSYHLNSFPKILTNQQATIKLLAVGTLYSPIRFIWCGPPSYFRYLRAECCKLNQQLNYLTRVTGLNKTEEMFKYLSVAGCFLRQFCSSTQRHSDWLKLILIHDVQGSNSDPNNMYT